MGRIEDKHKKRKEEDKPLGEFGKTKRETNKVDIDEETIKEQENKE